MTDLKLQDLHNPEICDRPHPPPPTPLLEEQSDAAGGPACGLPPALMMCAAPHQATWVCGFPSMRTLHCSEAGPTAEAARKRLPLTCTVEQSG